MTTSNSIMLNAFGPEDVRLTKRRNQPVDRPGNRLDCVGLNSTFIVATISSLPNVSQMASLVPKPEHCQQAAPANQHENQLQEP